MTLYHRCLLAVAVLLAAGIFAGPPLVNWWQNRPRDSGQGKVFKQNLLNALESAKEVRIVEHSDALDFEGTRYGDQRDPPEYDYGSKALTPSELQELMRQVRGLDPFHRVKPPDFCLFCPHHRFEIQGPSGRSVLEVCFQCEQISWQGSGGEEPDAFVPMLSRFVASVGLSPKREWDVLAKEIAGERISVPEKAVENP